jgi:hypothetical protein
MLMLDVQPCSDPGWTVAVKVELASVITQVFLIVLALGSLVVALVSIRRQLWLATFTEYTRRYADAMHHMPFDARRAAPPKSLDTVDEEYRKSVLTAMRRYFNLCSEELYLRKIGRIDKKTWEIWLAGIKDSTKEPYFASSWEFLRPEYGGFPEFCSFVDDIVKQSRK